jgi:hypothetical protein
MIVASTADGSIGGCQGGGRIGSVLSRRRWTSSRPDLALAVKPFHDYLTDVLGSEPNCLDALLRGKWDAMTSLSVTGLIDDQHASTRETKERMLLPKCQSPPAEGSSIPRGVVQEVMQVLADQLVAEGVQCGATVKEVIESCTEPINVLSPRIVGLHRVALADLRR